MVNNVVGGQSGQGQGPQEAGHSSAYGKQPDFCTVF